MIFLVGSKIDQTSIRSSLGKPEYSYYFLMKDFLPLLERLGTVMVVESLSDVERLTDEYRATGETVVYFSFSPPQQVPLGLPCPTIVVFAWEFDSLPSVAWDGHPQNDWRYSFARVCGAISTSREAAELVEKAMSAGYPVLACPAPVWNRFAACSVGNNAPRFDTRSFPFQGVVIDSPRLGLSADGLVRKPEPHVAPEPLPESPSEPAVVPVEVGRLHLAWLTSKALFQGWRQEVFEARREPVKVAPELSDSPSLPAEPPQALPVSVSGVVYSTVLNPADGRKNWVEIITAFCWAFKEVEDATLVVKMTHHDLEYYRIVMLTLLSRLAPFKCRVVVLHGFLDDEQYRALIDATSFYVNASAGEGLCLPLMEFLSAGKPALAPTHTAMADYMDAQVGFEVACALEPFCWPHDPTGVYMTHRHRLNWESLLNAFRRSHEVACSEPAEYRRLAIQARERMHQFASVDSLASTLHGFIKRCLTEAGKGRQP